MNTAGKTDRRGDRCLQLLSRISPDQNRLATARSDTCAAGAFASDHDVGWLKVTMHNARLMSSIEALCDLARD